MTSTPPPIPKLPGYTVSLPVSASGSPGAVHMCALTSPACLHSFGYLLTHWQRVLILQQSLGDKRLPKGQTLSYINGYAREEPLREVKDVAPREASPAATSSPAMTNSLSPSRFADSPTKLPQWVENDRKVCSFTLCCVCIHVPKACKRAHSAHAHNRGLTPLAPSGHHRFCVSTHTLRRQSSRATLRTTGCARSSCTTTWRTTACTLLSLARTTAASPRLVAVSSPCCAVLLHACSSSCILL